MNQRIVIRRSGGWRKCSPKQELLGEAGSRAPPSPPGKPRFLSQNRHHGLRPSPNARSGRDGCGSTQRGPSRSALARRRRRARRLCALGRRGDAVGRVSVLWVDAPADPLHLGTSLGVPERLVRSAGRRLHSLRLCPRQRPRPSLSVVRGQRLLERRHEPALPLRPVARLPDRLPQALADGVGRRHRVCVHLRAFARCAQAVPRSAERDELPRTAGAPGDRRLGVELVQRHGGGVLLGGLGSGPDRVGRPHSRRAGLELAREAVAGDGAARLLVRRTGGRRGPRPRWSSRSLRSRRGGR